jgi:hypothetical protein
VNPRTLAGSFLAGTGVWLGILAAVAWSGTLLAGAFTTYFVGLAIIGTTKDPR